MITQLITIWKTKSYQIDHSLDTGSIVRGLNEVRRSYASKTCFEGELSESYLIEYPGITSVFPMFFCIEVIPKPVLLSNRPYPSSRFLNSVPLRFPEVILFEACIRIGMAYFKL